MISIYCVLITMYFVYYSKILYFNVIYSNKFYFYSIMKDPFNSYNRNHLCSFTGLDLHKWVVESWKQPDDWEYKRKDNIRRRIKNINITGGIYLIFLGMFFCWFFFTPFWSKKKFKWNLNLNFTYFSRSKYPKWSKIDDEIYNF